MKIIPNVWYDFIMKVWMFILGFVGLALTAGVMTVWMTRDPRCFFMQCLIEK